MTRFLLNLFMLPLLISISAPFGFPMDRIPVFVSIVPQRYFVQQIGKDAVDIQVMVHPGANPATYEPKPRQMADLSRAKVYFFIGVPFEKTWLGKIASVNPKMKMVQTDRDIEKIPMARSPHHGQEGGNHKRGDHRTGGLDPHIWLSPPLVKIQARTIFSALQEMDPSRRSLYEANYLRFMSRIDGLDKRLREIFAGQRGLQFMVFHPAWGYFARAYGLQQVPVEIEGKNPKPAQLKALIEHARGKGIKVVFVQPQFSTKSAELVAKEIGGQVTFANPLAEDWMGNLYEVAVKFKAALR